MWPLQVWDELDVATQLPAAFVYDAAAGAVLHAAGPDAASVLQRLDRMELQSLLWSPGDCHHLLVYGHWTGGSPPAGEPAGVLAIVNVVLDQVAACSDILTMRKAEDEGFRAATWHPGSQGFVTSWDIALADPDCFRAAGFAVGTVLEPLHVGDSFSADGSHFIALHEQRVNDMATLMHELFNAFLRRRYTMLTCTVASAAGTQPLSMQPVRALQSRSSKVCRPATAQTWQLAPHLWAGFHLARAR